MVHSLGFVRLRWFVLLWSAVIIFMLFHVFFLWQQLTLFSDSSSPRGGFTASRATIQAKANYDVRMIANDLKKTDPDADYKTLNVETMEDKDNIQLLETQLLYSLYNLTQNTTETRGIVLPLNDTSMSLGLSLVMDLRSLDVMLPIEIPHCGDLNEKMVAMIEKKRYYLGQIRVYDACQVAAQEKSLRRPVFCQELAECYQKFRTGDIKVLAVIYSWFEELILVDANTLLLQNPMRLWETDKYQKTGTLFFNDKVSQTNISLGYRPASRLDVTELRHYLSNVDVSIFRQLSTIPRNKATVVSDVVLPFEPSDMLLNSHAWNGRSGHQMDSLLLLWSKKRQPRATAVLASFVSMNKVDRPPFYGDKELFFVACELAETQYAFSDFGVGAAGSVFKDLGEDKSIICGRPVQFYPEKSRDKSNTSLLYLNLGAVMAYKPKTQTLYFSEARAADFYPSFSNDRNLSQNCPFDVTGVAFSDVQVQRVLVRQHLHDIALEWERNVVASKSEREQTEANVRANTKLEALLKQLHRRAPLDESGAAPVVTAVYREPTELERKMETRLIYSLSTLSQQTSMQRGIVLPLYHNITTLGVSLILQLRSFGMDLPIEVPHCGDFDENYGETMMKKREQLGEVYVYNVCKRALTAKSILDPSESLFCEDLDDCHYFFQNFLVKVLSVVLSRFEEIMLLDADVLLFQSPMLLWETKKYQTTGTLFFNDRIAEANFSAGLGYKPANRPNIMAIEDYMSKANVDLFRHIPTLARPNVPAARIAADKSSATLHFQPSEGLLNSHAWNGRSAHRVDSSILLWNKKRQPRATAILASFVSLNDVPRPPSYGDKEYFFVACELAETQYTFSDFATGSAGSIYQDSGANKSVICGSAAHYFPEKSEDTLTQEASLFYLNSDNLMHYEPKESPIYYSAARPRDFFPGFFEERQLSLVCPFNITIVNFADAEVQYIYQRQRFFEIAKSWGDNFEGLNTTEREAADTFTNEELKALLHRIEYGPTFEGATDPPNYLSKAEHEEQEKKSAELESSEPDELQKQEKELIRTLNEIAQLTIVKRGVVIPVYDGIIKLAISLVLELRTIGITEPIEMPYCGDLNPDVQKLYLTKKQLGTIWFYDVCVKAERTASIIDPSRKAFCNKIEDCHAKFRSSFIKPLAVTFSRFEEIMVVDANTTFFVSPAKLWDSKKYNKTGNFLMHDRISQDRWFMAKRVPGKPEVSVEQDYFSNFDVKLFQLLHTLERPKATLKNPTSLKLNFEPSNFLLSSHSFNLRAGHQVDSSLVLWNKKRQPRATAILASFIALNNISAPPSNGDKEFFFYASELAETQYSFSDHATSAVGTKFTDGGPKNSTLCGDMAQVFPIHQDDVPDDDVPLFYLNSDRLLWFRPKTEPVYYMKARPWEFYPGAFGERKQECPFDITVGRLSEEQERHLAGRQHLYEVVEAWNRVASLKPDNLDEQNASIDKTLRKVIGEMQGKSPTNIATSPPRESGLIGWISQMMDKQLVYTLSQIAQRTKTKRGIVIPLYEPIARLGFSLILELRAMGISLPIEVPYCADLSPRTIELIQTKKELGDIRAYDVCGLAANAKSATNPLRSVFCNDIDGCYAKFRSFMIKPLAVVYSQFEQILMLDADTTFFVNPTVLFDSEKFKATGILLMHDRISHDWFYMAEAVVGKPGWSVEQEYFSKFDVTPFRPLPTLERPKATVQNKTPVKLNFEPSDFLLSSHSFNIRSGHQVDSSLVMWDKKRQPRATAILASFVAQNDIASPPAYGDKELFFYASELAETQYSFSDHAIGGVGTKLEDGGPKNSTLCGDMAQVFPIHQDGVPDDDVPLFYLNSDRILSLKPDEEPVYYMKARPWAHYPGAFGNRPHECPFNITVGKFDEFHTYHLAERQNFAKQAKAW